MFRRFNIIKYSAFLGVLIATFGFSKPESVEEVWAKRIRAYNKKMSQIDFPSGSKVYRFQYTNKVEMWDSLETPNSSVNVDIIMAENQIHYLTKDIKIYQDLRDAFMIIDSKKMVIRSTSSLRIDRKKKLKELVELRDTLFKAGKVSNCQQEVTKEGRKFMRITLVPESKMQKVFKIAQVTYWYDVEKDVVAKVKTDFDSRYQSKSITMIYKDMELNYKINLSDDVQDLVVNKNQKLISKYKKYQLVDNR